MGQNAPASLQDLNLKGEFAYNMTEDFDGDDAAIHNNNIKWVGGFDRDIPLNNVNINIQESGTYIINADKITGNSDVEAVTAETENILIVSLSDNYNHEKIEARATGMYHFEDNDWMIVPELTFSLDDNWEASLSGRFLGGDDDTLFGQFDDNDEVKLSASYSF